MMYEVFKNVIESGNFKVNDLTNKIDTLWAEGRMSDDERAALIASMTDHINPSTEAPELARQISMVAEQVAEMKDQIAALIADVATLKNPEGSEEGGGEETESDPLTGKIPDWEPWDGISDRYQRGAIVRENGEYYVNVLSGMQNTWQPGTAE